MKKEDAVKVIALTLAELHGDTAPSVTHWGQAKVFADLFEQRGHLSQSVETPEVKRQEPPMWQGDREYLQAQHEKSWTPERYGGSK